jgi:hypothetical protein
MGGARVKILVTAQVARVQGSGFRKEAIAGLPAEASVQAGV